MKKTPSLIVLFVCATIGFIDATYLTMLHFLNRIPPCSIGSCEIVTTSTYSVIFGIPVALLGALYYLALLAVIITFATSDPLVDGQKKYLALRVLATIVSIGMLFTLFLVYLQLFVLHAICLYCMLSATTTLILFITTMYLVRTRKPDRL